jgi:hypothetical protein
MSPFSLLIELMNVCSLSSGNDIFKNLRACHSTDRSTFVLYDWSVGISVCAPRKKRCTEVPKS